MSGIEWRSIDESPPAPAAPKPAASWFGWLPNAPWWLISAGLHVVLLLAGALIAVERSIAIEEGAVDVRIAARAPELTIERPRDLFERKGVPRDDPAAPLDEPALFFPEAKESDHHESADNEDYRAMKGDSKNFLSYTPGETGGFRGRQASHASGVSDSLGVGSGGGNSGRYGARFGGRENLVARGGGGGTEDAVRAALRWLARHQSADGSWGAATYTNACARDGCSGSGARDYDVGVTALSLLAFLGAGYSHLSRDEIRDPQLPGRTVKFGQVVRDGVKWLIAQQGPDGCIGPPRGHYMYNHAIGALALSEAYGMTNAGPLAGPAQKAIDYLVLVQNYGKGWRYTAGCGDNDTSVTGWAAMALKSADLSGLKFREEAYDGIRAWLDEVTDSGYGRAGYTRRPSANARERWLSPTSIAIMSRIFIDKNRADPRLWNGCDQLLMVKPVWEEGRIDFYYWYYASLALFQFDGPDGVKWRAWNENMKAALVKNQLAAPAGCRSGSWDPLDLWSRAGGGRVYATAINALTLEVYYRYANVFGTK
jgi:hypothetical protein